MMSRQVCVIDGKVVNTSICCAAAAVAYSAVAAAGAAQTVTDAIGESCLAIEPVEVHLAALLPSDKFDVLSTYLKLRAWGLQL